MRKIMALACLGTLPLLLSACGGGTPDQNQGTDQTAAPAVATPQAPPPVSPPPGNAVPESAPEATSAATTAATPPVAFAQCQACHSTEPGKHGIGPSLVGVYGTKAGEIPGFSFSPAMKASGLVWDDATLDRYLKAPQAVVPGTRMAFAGLKDDAKRAAVIAYLKSLR